MPNRSQSAEWHLSSRRCSTTFPRLSISPVASGRSAARPSPQFCRRPPPHSSSVRSCDKVRPPGSATAHAAVDVAPSAPLLLHLSGEKAPPDDLSTPVPLERAHRIVPIAIRPVPAHRAALLPPSSPLPFFRVPAMHPRATNCPQN